MKTHCLASRSTAVSCLLLIALAALQPRLASGQPGSGGISIEEAMKQANELLRQQGIDPTGAGHANDAPAQPQMASPVAKQSSTQVFTPLTLEEIRNNPDVWPAEVVILERVEFGSGLRLTPGNRVDFAGFADSETAYLDYGNSSLTLPVALIDLEERANAIASGQAKAEGFRGRILEQLDGRIVVQSGNDMRTSSTDGLADADLFLFYMSSDACGWCGRFTPKLRRAVDAVQRQYPGRLKVIHASVDRNLNEFRSNYGKIGADAAIPPGDRWYINAYSTSHPGVSQIPQPSLMLVNASGRVIDSGQRAGSNMSAPENLLQKLPGYVANANALVPAWTRLESPLTQPKASQTAAPINLPPAATSSDPTIVGPEPYPATADNGAPIPGLVLYDNQSSGGRIPALTLQQVPTENGQGYVYILSFRQVLGQTFGSSKPLLTGWMKTTTRDGAMADADLADRVADYKALAEKFQQWKQTAIDNGVSDFIKPIYTIPQTYLDSRYTRPAFAIPGKSNSGPEELEVLFTISGKPEDATLKTETITWMLADMDAFTRLIPQIDLLVAQLPREKVRLGEERSQKVQEAQDVDALFQ